MRARTGFFLLLLSCADPCDQPPFHTNSPGHCFAQSTKAGDDARHKPLWAEGACMVDRDDLVRQLKVLRERQSNSIGHETNEDTFPVWVLLALATESPRLAAEAICGGAYDGGNDAILIDSARETIWIVQGKFPLNPGVGNEPAGSVGAFAQIAERLFEDESESAEPQYWKHLARNKRGVLGRFRLASKAVRMDGYKARLVYASLANFNSAVAKRSQDVVRAVSPLASLDLLGWSDIKRLLGYYIRNAAPGPPKLVLEVSGGDPSRSPMGSQDLVARVFSTTGEQVASLLADGGESIFARNIRLGLGAKVQVNRAIAHSIRHDPASFWFLNNGLTVACTNASYNADEATVDVYDAQVINGQQTTRTLFQASLDADEDGDAALKSNLRRLQVGVRVIELGSDTPEASDALIDKIVEATNFQNAISQADLRSNEIEQIDLERDLASRGYEYKRRKGSAEPGAERPDLAYLKVKLTREQLATAVVGALHESVPLREGRAPLFNPDFPYYDEVFKKQTTDFLLMCFWLWRRVGKRASGNSNRQATKHLVHYELYQSMRGTLRRNAAALTRACELNDARVVEPLNVAIDSLFGVAIAAYRHNYKNTGTRSIKPYHQSREVNAYGNFLSEWNSDLNGTHQLNFENVRATLSTALSG